MIRFTRPVVLALSLAIVTLGAQAKHWGYEDRGDSVGPTKWGTLPGNEACAAGKQQTPIDIVAGVVKPQDLPNLVFGYKPSRLSMSNNGHTVQMTYDAGSTLSRTGSTATSSLAQFHFHAPSEHTVDGRVLSDGGASGPRRRRRQAGRRRGRLHQVRHGTRRVGGGVSGSAGQIGRQERAGRRDDRCSRAATRRQDVLYLRGIADDAAVHGRPHLVRAQDPD